MSAIPTWETQVLEAVGRIIEFWGFKRNHGRLWALLYLSDEPMSAATLGRRLKLSKGAVSMVVRELQTWAVIRRVPSTARSGVAYAAERDLWLMIETVLRQREVRLVSQVLEMLSEAELGVARDTRLSPAQKKSMATRIRRLRRFAEAGQTALDMFVRSRRLNFEPLQGILDGRLPLRRSSK